MEIKIRRKRTLEPMLKEIFGDIVKCAYVRITEYNGGSMVSVNNNAVDVDYEDTLVVELTNGKFIKFWSSEWGQLSGVEPSDIEIIESIKKGVN